MGRCFHRLRAEPRCVSTSFAARCACKGLRPRSCGFPGSAADPTTTGFNVLWPHPPRQGRKSHHRRDTADIGTSAAITPGRSRGRPRNQRVWSSECSNNYPQVLRLVSPRPRFSGVADRSDLPLRINSSLRDFRPYTTTPARRWSWLTALFAAEPGGSLPLLADQHAPVDRAW